MIGNQIDTLSLGLSFGHNLCFKYLNKICEPILNIYVLRTFQWYKEFFNLMSFDPWNRSQKICESIGIPSPKVGAHLGVCGFIFSHLPTFLRTWNVTPELHFRPTPLQALALIMNPKLRSRQILSLNIGTCFTMFALETHLTSLTSLPNII